MQSNGNQYPPPPPPPPGGAPSSGGGGGRTIQVKVGNHSAAQAMTPNQAAEYLKALAMGSAGGGGGGGGTSSVMSGSNNNHNAHPHLPSTTTTTVTTTSATTAATATATATTTRSNSSSKPVARRSNNNNSNNPNNSTTMPCSEKEMKALMSMFVEIMGLQMNTEKLNQQQPSISSTTKRKATTHPEDNNNNNLLRLPVPTHIPAPPDGWPHEFLWVSRPDVEDDDEEEDRLPDLEDVVPTTTTNTSNDNTNGSRKMASATHPTTTSSSSPFVLPLSIPTHHQQPVTGLVGLAVFEWDALERIAIEDALEQEERARKHARNNKNSTNKSSLSQRNTTWATTSINAATSSTTTASARSAAAIRMETATKVAQLAALAKKRDKVIQSWKSKVSAAVAHSSGGGAESVSQLQALLAESPLRPDEVTPVQLESLASLCVATKRHNHDGAAAATTTTTLRMELVRYVAQKCPAALIMPLRSGRSVLHTASFHAELELMQCIIDAVHNSSNSNSNSINGTCLDSGWTPLHYAALSGSLPAVELLLNTGQANLRAVTNDTHTWHRTTNQGVTAQQLAEWVRTEQHDRVLETHGMALQEVFKDVAQQHETRRQYMARLDRIVKRLAHVEANGYIALTIEELEQEEALARKVVVQQKQESKGGSKDDKARSLDENKAAGMAAEVVTGKMTTMSVATTKSPRSKEGHSDGSSSTVGKTNSNNKSNKEDPMVTALIGMGFSKGQVLAGIAACGGSNRATADDVVAWIFGHDADKGVVVGGSTSVPETASVAPKPTRESSKPKRQQQMKATEGKRQDTLRRAEEERLATEQLAAKREEQRRRNREWNNRAQVRQRQEDQAKFTTSAAASSEPNARTERVSLQPASNLLPAMVPAAAFAVTRSGSPPRVEGLRGFPEHVITNDASTIASSIDNASVENINDDATISTIGSFQARATPVTAQFGQPPKITKQVVPPGFGQSQVIPQPAHAAPPMMIGGRSFSVPGNSMVPPPGIPETHPLLEGAIPSSAFNTLGGAPRLSSNHEMLAGGVTFGSAPSNGLLGGPLTAPLARLGHNQGSRAGPTNQLFSGLPVVAPMPPQAGYRVPLDILPPLPPSLAPAGPAGHAGHAFSGPTMGLSLGGSPKNSQPLDSSVIDSISTGDTFLPGAALWLGQQTKSTSGSSLLGNLIQQNSTIEGEQPYQSNIFGDHNGDSESSRWGRQESLGRKGSGSIW